MKARFLSASNWNKVWPPQEVMRVNCCHFGPTEVKTTVSVVVVSQDMGVGEGTQREGKDVHSNALIQEKKKKRNGLLVVMAPVS